MPTVYDAPPEEVIRRIAQHLKEKVKEVEPPPWATFVKTGAHKERPPEERDWWYVRAASILRKLYLKGPIGVEKLRKEYGGRKRFPMRKAHKWKGGGSNIRKILQQLERAGLVQTVERKGRVLTNKGKSLLDKIASQILKEEIVAQ